MLSTNGDTFLGGEDFDLKIIDFFSDELKENGVTKKRYSVSKGGEKAKIELFNSQQTEVNLPYTADQTGPKNLTKLTPAQAGILGR